MTSQNQLNYFRDLVRRDLMPLVVLRGELEWVCAWCGRKTLIERAEAARMALHWTQCRLRIAQEVHE